MGTRNNYYYDVAEDLNNYDKAWCYIIVGGRNTGKTYSSLIHCLKRQKKFVFVKRTIEDVNLLCAGSGKIGTKQNEYGLDFSPFKAINRDLGTNIKAFSIKDGLGGFWSCDEDNNPQGLPIGYLISLSAVQKFKGFDLSDCDYIIFDEFIPQPWERINRREGEQLLDLYKTVARDREHRNLKPLKLLCLANATSISNPTMNILEVTDIMADMNIKDIGYNYDEFRGILLHRINDNIDFQEKEKESLLYKAMHETQWGQMAFENKFGYNDFTNVGHLNLKGFRPVCNILYKKKHWYIYQKDGMYYMCCARNNSKQYNLNLENDQMLFYLEQVVDLKEACINGMMKFEHYSMYDLIRNYRKVFNLN